MKKAFLVAMILVSASTSSAISFPTLTVSDAAEACILLRGHIPNTIKEHGPNSFMGHALICFDKAGTEVSRSHIFHEQVKESKYMSNLTLDVALAAMVHVQLKAKGLELKAGEYESYIYGR